MRYLHAILVVAVCVLMAASSAEGQNKNRPRVRHVSFHGNTIYDASRLEGLMLTRPSRFLATVRYHREVFEDDLATLETFYRQNGYLQARVTDTSVTLDSAANEVDISIGLEEGMRTFVEGVAVFDNGFFADSVLTDKYIGIKPGDPLRRPVIEDAVVVLLSLYAEHGFLDASVTPKVQVNDSARLAMIDFSLLEGVQSYVGKINIVGAEKTQPGVVKRELSFAVGDTIKYSRLIASQRRLYLTGLFESVFVRPVAPDSGETREREIRVEVKEKQSSELAFSVGYGTVEKVRGRIELNTFNLSGTARSAGLGLEANFIKQSASASFSEPWTLGTRWRTDFSLYGQLRQEPGYHAETIGSKLTVGRRIKRHTTISLSYRLENTNLSHFDLTVPLDEPDPRIRSLALTVSHDTRDNLFDPSRGWYVNWSNEVAGTFLSGSNTFVKTTLTVKNFRPLGRQAVLGSALEVGWMDRFGQSVDIPLSERFYTGGPTSLRGFGYQRVGPVDPKGEPLGGRFKIVWNLLELRRSIFRFVGGAIFIDIGNVWTRPNTARFSDLRADVGAGLRVNSPLGIVRLDYGVNVDKLANEPPSRLFLSMGQAF